MNQIFKQKCSDYVLIHYAIRVHNIIILFLWMKSARDEKLNKEIY